MCLHRWRHIVKLHSERYKLMLRRSQTVVSETSPYLGFAHQQVHRGLMDHHAPPGSNRFPVLRDAALIGDGVVAAGVVVGAG